MQNRINLNNQLIQKLEETAQAIYKSWFVDFEFPSPLNSPPLEGCPQDGVVNMPQPDHQDGVVNMPQPEPQDPPKLKRNAVNYFSLPYNPELRQRARDLRKAGNLAEVLFWKQVRNKSFKGLDFDRQKIIGNYIVDFYCPNCQVVVEIDGASHNDKQDYDARRNEYLKSIGLTVIHFTDYEVKENIDSVMQFLDVHPAMNLDGVDKSNQQVTQGVNASGRFDHPVLRTPLQRRGMPQSGYKSSGGEMVWNEELEKEIPEGWRVGTVADLCEYSSQRISINELSLDNYISTENMLQNRGGIVQANNLPNTGSVIKFEIGNILISNIRPYFKKIWLVNFNGGCSNDVMCFSPNKNVPPLYLYQILEKDNFFDYVMAGSKGTKMPRGDIKWIMNYETVIPSNDLLEKYSRTTQVFQRDIQIKKSENQKLTELKELLLSKLATNNN